MSDVAIICLVFVVLMFIGVPIYAVVGFSVAVALHYADIPQTMLAQTAFTALQPFPLLSVPMFVLAGRLMEKGGMADKAMGKIRPLEQTQPISFARGDAPPLWLATGDEDETVRPRNSQNLAAAIERVGGSAALRLYPGMGHTGIVMALSAPFRSRGPVLDEATDFLRGVTGRRIAPAADAAE